MRTTMADREREIIELWLRDAIEAARKYPDRDDGIVDPYTVASDIMVELDLLSELDRAREERDEARELVELGAEVVPWLRLRLYMALDDKPFADCPHVVSASEQFEKGARAFLQREGEGG